MMTRSQVFAIHLEVYAYEGQESKIDVLKMNKSYRSFNL